MQLFIIYKVFALKRCGTFRTHDAPGLSAPQQMIPSRGIYGAYREPFCENAKYAKSAAFPKRARGVPQSDREKKERFLSLFV